MDGGWEEAAGEHLAQGVARLRLPGWDATAGLVHGPAGALVVDAGATLREGAAIRRWACERSGGRVTHLALTHGHFDHVLGAAAFAGVSVHGAVGLDGLLATGREELAADAVRHGADPEAAAQAADLPVRPHHLVSGELTVDLGGDGVRREAVLVNAGPGHTAYDLAVLVPGDPCVVFCGDLVEESGEPQAGHDAVPEQWPAALDRLLALGGEDARYVPGHGAVVDAAFVRAQRDQLAARFGVS